MPPCDGCDDVTLMARAAADEQDAFRTLVERYQNALLNFFLRAGVSYDDGLDLAQRTFLRLWRYRVKYTPQAKFTTFLFMLATQEKLDFFRGEGRRGRLTARLEQAAERDVTVGVMNADGPAASACRARPEAVETAPDDAGVRVRRAVAGLSPALRDVVELGVFQDMPYADVGEVLGIPVGTVKSRMFNALKKLKEMLA